VDVELARTPKIVSSSSLDDDRGWPEPYIYTVYDHIFGDFPAKNTVYTPYIYGSGQPYVYSMNMYIHTCLHNHEEWWPLDDDQW
jgi:hypothetical protein